MPLPELRIQLARTRQKRKALHMLALSGVVRPSHVGLRYTIPLLSGDDQPETSREAPATTSSNFLRRLFAMMRWRSQDEGLLRRRRPSNGWLRLRKRPSTSLHVPRSC